MKSWDDYKGILPYASELFGIYQPLLGWKSRLTSKRFDRFRNRLYRRIAEETLTTVRAPLQVQVDRMARSTNAAANVARAVVRIDNLKPLTFFTETQPYLSQMIDSGVARLLLQDIGSKPPTDWKEIVTTDRMTTLLEKLKEIVTTPGELQDFPEVADYLESFSATLGTRDQATLLQAFFDKE